MVLLNDITKTMFNPESVCHISGKKVGEKLRNI
jgi:hypothetical protein